MSWSFRRSKKVGPFRINLSKSGIGVSAGVKGLRVGRDAKGRTYSSISVPGTGLYNRQHHSTAKGKYSGSSANQETQSATATDTMLGILLLVTIVVFISGHWLIGMLCLCATFVIAGAIGNKKPEKSSTEGDATTKDLRHVGNMPRETLDYLASKQKFKSK